MDASLHDAYAADYDRQVREYSCYLADCLFGLCFEFVRPGQRLLDAGTGSGLSAILFARAGLAVSGFDFSPAMLEICRAKGIAEDLKLHDITLAPWPYAADRFDHVICCGVTHFIPDLEAVFSEARRVLRPGGVFAFTSKVPAVLESPQQKYQQTASGNFTIYSHAPGYIESLSTQQSFIKLKAQKYLSGEDSFETRVLRKG